MTCLVKKQARQYAAIHERQSIEEACNYMDEHVTCLLKNKRVSMPTNTSVRL